MTANTATADPGPRATLREAALARRAEIEARYPAAFAADLGRRAGTIGAAALVVGLFVFGLATLDIPWRAIPAGLGRLGEFAAEAQESREAQRNVEAADKTNFDTYLALYLAD